MSVTRASVDNKHRLQFFGADEPLDIFGRLISVRREYPRRNAEGWFSISTPAAAGIVRRHPSGGFASEVLRIDRKHRSEHRHGYELRYEVLKEEFATEDAALTAVANAFDERRSYFSAE